MTEFKVSDPVINNHTGNSGIVIETSEKFGWILVEWENGKTTRYDAYAGPKQSIRLDWDKVNDAKKRSTGRTSGS
jgi:hypothetical protein